RGYLFEPQREVVTQAAEADLVGTQIEKDLHLRGLRLDGLDPELDAQVPAWKLEGGRGGGVEIALEAVAPATLLAEGGELGLPTELGRKPIRINGRLAFGIGQQVDFAMGLLERLAHPVGLEPVPPGQHFGSAHGARMPERHARLSAESIEWFVPGADGL